MMLFNIDKRVIFCLFILKLISEASSPYEKSYACLHCAYTEVSRIQRKPCESAYRKNVCSGTPTVHFAWALGGRGNLFPSNSFHTTDVPTNVAYCNTLIPRMINITYLLRLWKLPRRNHCMKLHFYPLLKIFCKEFKKLCV